MRKLQQLHAEMKACRRCVAAGYEVEPPAVFSSGSAPQVMVIGQAPGVTEVEAQRPFNAGSGTRLFQWLGEAGWAEEAFRARHYMTAVTKCYPGKNSNGKGDRVPTRAEQKLCRPFLEREIALVNPRLIIPVGGLAIKLFYPNRLRLDEVVGTAVYLPPTILASTPTPFTIKQAHQYTADAPNLQSLISNLQSTNLPPPPGRFLVPLPHPSGASLWPNKPANRRLIRRAIAILSDLRQALGL